ncbi:hypothetical protein BD413DRAFT_69690 [Trametes elegans]|nr:hypothetical protein BD413DRAFT_69690 [Trametes elegans]
MSGLVYSELANWDGSLSGTQAGNTRESTVPISGSPPPPSLPLPRSSPMSVAPNFHAVDSAARSEANKPPSPVGYSSNAPGSGPSVAQNERALMDGARRSEKLVAAVLKEQSYASKPVHQSSPRARESPTLPAHEDPAPSTRHSPLFTPEPESEATDRCPGSPAATARMRQIMIHRPAPRAAAGVTQAIRSFSRPTTHPEHSQQRVTSNNHIANPTAPIAGPSLSPDVPHPHIAQEPSPASSIHVQPQLLTQQGGRATHSREPSSARSPVTHSQEGFRDSFTGEDLDAEGDTDHESTVSIHAPPVASSSRASASVHVTTERNVRSSAESTAVAGSRAPSREHHIKYTEGSYSDDFLQAVQQYYVSRSPSIPAQERIHGPDRPSASPLQPALSRPFIQRAQSPPPSQQRVQLRIPPVDLGVWLRSPTCRSLSLSEMSPLTTPTASPVSVRTALTKRRRLNQPYVEVPPLPANKPRSAYKLARDIPVLQGKTVEIDYAVQLKQALNHASMINHDLMRNSESPSVAATPRRRLRRRVAASVPPSKQVSVEISPIIPRKRGRPKGFKDKPKVMETKQFEVREERKSPEAQEEHRLPEVAEKDGDQTHPPADNLEPYLPSSFVELGELPEASATMFKVAFRALIDAKTKDLAGAGVAHPAGKATASAPAAKHTAPAQFKEKVLPLPRRSLFMKTQPGSLSTAPDLPTSSNQPGPSSSARSSPQPGYSSQPLSSQPRPSSHARLGYAPTVAAVSPSSPHTSPQSAQISASCDMSPRSTTEHKLYKAVSIDSAELSGLNLLADYDFPRSSGGVSDANRASDDPTRTPQSITARSEQSSYGPDVGEGVLHHTQQPRIMQFHYESQYSIAGPSDVADMFAADKALREAQGDHHLDGGMQPDALDLVGSYFSPLDLGIQYESEMGHPWMPDNLSATDNRPGQPNGTIDPSLLGTVVAPGPELRPLIPSPPSASAAGPSNAWSATVPASPGPSRSLHRSHTSMTPSGSMDSDSDRPHSAKRRRVEEQRPQLPIRLLCEMERDSPKRLRRLTERARMSYIELEESDDDLPAPEVKAARNKGKGKGKDKEKAQAQSDDSFDETSHRVLAEQPTFCHQCRRKSKYEKMRCTTIRDTGEVCGLRFCERCVMNRYPDMDFDAYAVRFKCPRCQDICNCTACCARRGEPYISARVGKLPPAGSTEALALAQEALSKSLRPVEHSGVQPSPSPSKLDLVGGQYFGVIYGLGGERVGAGFVGRDNEGIVLGSARGPSKPLSKAVAYIGKPRARAAPPRPVPTVAEQTATASSNIASGPNDGGMSNTVLDIPLGIPHGTVIDPLANFSAPTLATDPHPQQRDPVRAGDGLLVPGRRMYIGKRAVLDDPTYVSMDVLPTLMEDEDKDSSQEWGAPLSDPISNSADENPEGEHGGQPSTEDVQWAIALALHAVQVVPVQH